MAVDAPHDTTRIFAEFKLPGLGLDEMLALQRRNVDALARANRLAVEGLQTLVRRQAEILRGGIEQASQLMRELGREQTAGERMGRQTEAAKAAVEQSLAHLRELSEIAARSSNEAIDVLSRRFGEGLDEASNLMAKGTGLMH